MSKPKKDLITQNESVIDEAQIFERVVEIIENRKSRAAVHINQETTLMFWEVGRYISSAILDFKRAAYGKKILSELATKLIGRYGRNFAERNIYRMMQFAEQFPDAEILSPLATKLSWSHFIELMPIKTGEARLYYAQDAAQRNYGTKELRHQISRKAYERREIANAELSKDSVVPFNVFRDPYLLDLFELRENFLEREIEYFYEAKDDDDEK